jgi:hypothetical protein
MDNKPRTLFYDHAGTNKIAVTTPMEASDPRYTTEQIFKRMQRNAEKLDLYNDGPGPWYVRTSPDGEQFSEEFLIKKGNVKTVKNIYELRHRSPRAGMKYRITEFELWSRASEEHTLFYKIAVAVSFVIGFGAGITVTILFLGCHVQP